jgi:hypothetical protein
MIIISSSSLERKQVDAAPARGLCSPRFGPSRSNDTQMVTCASSRCVFAVEALNRSKEEIDYFES